MQAITGATYQTTEEAYSGGKVRAEAAFDASGSPILLMDELCDSDIDRAFAIGWNSVAMCEANFKRLTALSRDPIGTEQSVEALQKLFAECATHALSEDPLKLNIK